MKHDIKIVGIILAMFIITQFIGLYVINYYSPVKVVDNVQENITSSNQLPFGLEPPPESNQANIWQTLLYIIPSFVIAISIFFILTKFKAEIVLKIWFFIVVIIALSTSIISFFHSSALVFLIISLAIAIPLAFFKIYRRNFLVHNLTELLIYPGIAAVFVALLSSADNPDRGIYSIIVLLILISIYDLWAVWHSGIMQKMAKYQINKLKIFAGFFIPYVSGKLRMKFKKMKKSDKRNRKIKINVALLGGGDVIYPLIAAGVVLRKFGFTSVLGLELPLASLLIVLGAVLGLSYILFFGERKKAYPAMPFISAGVFVALGLCYLIF
jgi:presenilin-like A22 family membrane protease